MPGTCHVTVTQLFLAQLLCRTDVTVIEATATGDGPYQIKLSSPFLPDGYHGQQECFIREGGSLGFRRETDT